MRYAAFLTLLLAGFATAEPGRASEEPPPMEERVFLTIPGALKETFPRASRFETETHVLADSARAILQQKLGGPVADDTVSVHRALGPDGALLGYAVVSEEIGKYHPITFMVGVAPDLRVERISILVYRESHGGDVRRERFLGQYRGKTAESPLRTNRDIINISGATLSVRALNYGVRKVLGLLDAFMAAPVEGLSR